MFAVLEQQFVQQLANSYSYTHRHAVNADSNAYTHRHADSNAYTHAIVQQLVSYY